MSKIAEQKALEIYPEDYAWVKCDNEETNYTEIDDEGTKWLKVESNKEFRVAYTKGYDQAMQDFMEKAERYLKNTLYDRVEIEVFGTLIPSIVSKKEFIDNLKNYMQN